MTIKKRVPVPKSNIRSSQKKEIKQFPIVGIGASAGGLEALELFFSNMPANNGMAFVVIQHLDPTHVGMMPELLQRITQMNVLQATDRLRVKPDYVYVIPPNKSLSLLNGSLHLFDPVETRGLRLPVDFFFRSLANDRQDKSIGIILSGMGSDGSLGLKSIKEKNGMVMVQDPATAKYDGMPNSAIEAVNVDIIALAEDLPAKLIDYLNYIPPVIPNPETDLKSKTNLEKIIILLREQSGHDFSQYKKTTLMRRIERRKGIHQIDKIQNYVRFLQENPKETEILFKELLIGVTNFFRDQPLWSKLQESIIPALLNKISDGQVLRAWIPACSTGEEAYSLAIIFKEVMEKMKNYKGISLQIFATDLDNDSIELARKGVFSKNISADVSPERISRYFTNEGGKFRVNSLIREMVVFAPQNVIKDPPFTNIDILSCRNMLIYMESQLQKKLIALFNYSLNSGGILILGSAETIGGHKEGFAEIDGRLKIYRKTAPLRTAELADFPSSLYSRNQKVQNKRTLPKAAENFQSIADHILLQRFTPPSVMVNENGDIIYITGRTGKYLEPVAGKANLNIYAMAREGLSEQLPGALRKAMQSFDPVVLRNIKIGTNGGTQVIDLTIQRLERPESMRGIIMIVFHDVREVIKDELLLLKPKKRIQSGHTKELEAELQRNREELQRTREEMQTSQEELKSSNEELQSTNEELQSTNEELTTSKEEMQSLNEELQTVNIELQNKVNDFMQASDDMKNLLNSIEIAALFLDKDLNIRRFTDLTRKIFKLRDTDIGRPFTDLVTYLNYPEIGNHARHVIKALIPIENAIKTTDQRWFNVRIMPYRTTEDRIDGLVMTFTDITTAKKLEIELKAANEALKRI